MSRPPIRTIVLHCPTDFADFARGKSDAVVARHYYVSTKTVRRWRSETGAIGCYQRERAA